MSGINPLFVQMALDWLDAEREANPDSWPAVPQRDHITIAIDRVYQVISGNVLRSEASPGDLAIWKSRVEDVPMFARSWDRKGRARAAGDKTKTSPADDPYNQVTPRRPGRIAPQRVSRWWNYFDTLTITESTYAERLFTNRNIGDIFMTNLQVPGQTGEDETFDVHRMYVAVSSLDDLQWGAGRITFQLIVGNRVDVSPTMFLRDLFRGVELERPIRIPPRQNFEVSVNVRQASRHPTEPGFAHDAVDPFDVTFHLEGFNHRV